MKLSQVEARAIAGHLGYGNPAAQLWFVGTEEGLGGAASDQENDANLKARSKWPPVVDMHAAHRTLQERGRFIDISHARAGHTGVWQWMAKIARAFGGEQDFCDTAKANEYVRARRGLGRSGGQTFLTELSPFPSKTADLPLALQEFGDTELMATLLARRTKRQMELLREGQSKCVICYGGSSRERFARHFGAEWETLARFPWVSARGKYRTTTVYHCNLRDGERTFAQLFMLPFLGNGAMCEEVLVQFVGGEEFQACCWTSD